MKNPKEALLKRLDNKYHDRVENFTKENDLIDNCKYLLIYPSNYEDFEHVAGGSLPCRSIKEAIQFIEDLEEVKK